MEAVRRSFVRRDFTRPRIVLSACMEIDACRHDGQQISDEFVRWLRPHVDLVPVCPEVEIGLGVPRDTIRLVAEGERTRMVQPATGNDLTARMHDFSQRYLDELGEVDGFVLKAGSPSCGTGGVKVYAGEQRGSAAVRTEAGLFAANVQARYGDIAVETDGRLRNYPIRHHFLTRIFACAELRELGPRPRAAALADFQRRHKHLLMTYDQHRMRELGAIAADGKGRSDADRFRDYSAGFHEALAHMPSHESYINSLMHMYGHFKKSLGAVETDEFMAQLEDFRHHRLPLHAVTSVIRSWCSRFAYDYFADQSLLEPYPRELVQMRDSGKGVDF